MDMRGFFVQIKPTRIRMMERGQEGEGEEHLVSHSIPHRLSNANVAVLRHWAFVATNGTGRLVDIDDVSQADRSKKMNCEVIGAMLSVHFQLMLLYKMDTMIIYDDSSIPDKIPQINRYSSMAKSVTTGAGKE